MSIVLTTFLLFLLQLFSCDNSYVLLSPGIFPDFSSVSRFSRLSGQLSSDSISHGIMTVMAGLLCCLFCLTGCCCRVPHFFISCIIQAEPKSLFSLTIEKSGHRLLCLFRFFLFMLWRSMFMRYRIIPILQETECKRKVFSGKISLLISTKFYKVRPIHSHLQLPRSAVQPPQLLPFCHRPCSPCCPRIRRLQPPFPPEIFLPR